MRHHTLVHEVDFKFIERAKAAHESEREPGAKIIQQLSFWEVKIPHHVRLWSHTRGIANQRTQVETGGRVWLKYFP